MAEFRTLRAGVFLPPFHPNDEDPLLCMERDFELMQWLDKHDYRRGVDRRAPFGRLRDLRPARIVHRHRRRAHPPYPARHRGHLVALPSSADGGRPHRPARLPDARPGDVRLWAGPVAVRRDDARHRPRDPARPHGRRHRHHHPPARRRDHHPAERLVHDARGAAAPAPLFEAAPASGDRQCRHPLWRQARRAL